MVANDSESMLSMVEGAGDDAGSECASNLLLTPFPFAQVSAIGAERVENNVVKRTRYLWKGASRSRREKGIQRVDGKGHHILDRPGSALTWQQSWFSRLRVQCCATTAMGDGSIGLQDQLLGLP